MKLKNKILTTLAACLFSYSVANAQTSASSFNKGTFYYGLEYYHYHEILNGHDPFVTVKSNPWPTFVLGYSDFSNARTNSKNDIPLIYSLEGTYGKNKYTNWNHSIGYGASSKDYTAQGEVSYVTPINVYAGVGYRYLHNKLNSSAAYTRIEEYFYLPLGYVYQLSDGSNFKFQYNYLIKGKNESDATEVGADSNLYFKQNSGWGLDLSYVPVNGQWEFYTKYWEIKNSDIQKAYVHGVYYDSYVEPHNKTYEIGFKHTF